MGLFIHKNEILSITKIKKEVIRKASLFYLKKSKIKKIAYLNFLILVAHFYNFAGWQNSIIFLLYEMSVNCINGYRD